MAEVALPPIVPESVYVPPEHITLFKPAFTVGNASMVKSKESTTEVQGPLGLSVSIIRVTFPLIKSVAPGV